MKIIPCILQEHILGSYTATIWAVRKHAYSWESLYWVNMNTDIKQTVKQCSMCLEYQHTQPCKTVLHYDIPHKPWEVVSADVFMINHKSLLCNSDYHSEFPVVKKVTGLSVNDLVHTAEMIFAEYGLPRKIFTFQNECYIRNLQEILKKAKHPEIYNVIILLPKQWLMVIKFVKCTIKKCTDTNQETNLALLQIQSTPVGEGLPSPATMLLNRPTQELLPQKNRAPINIENDDAWYEALGAHQNKYNKEWYSKKTFCPFCRVYCSSPVGGWGCR